MRPRVTREWAPNPRTRTPTVTQILTRTEQTVSRSTKSKNGELRTISCFILNTALRMRIAFIIREPVIGVRTLNAKECKN